MKFKTAIFFTFFLCHLSFAQKSESKAPNVIFILADDMGYGDVSALNPAAKTHTPSIDKLIKNGLTFTNAYTTAPVCTPSRQAIISGRYAWRSESRGYAIDGFHEPVMDSSRATIANIFKEAGHTTAFIGKWHLGVDWQLKDEKLKIDRETGNTNVDYSQPITQGPNDYGFDYSYILPASLDMPPYLFLRNHSPVDTEILHTSDVYRLRLEETKNEKNPYTGEKDIYWGKGVWWRQGEIAESFKIETAFSDIIDEGENFLERQVEANPEEPFFLFLSLTGPHTPWMPTPEFKGKSSIKTYGDFMLTIDNGIGKILKQLERLGITKNTLIIFTSDNGAPWTPEDRVEFEHDPQFGRRGQKGDVWDGGYHTPLVFYWPAKIQREKQYEGLISLTDLYATFADLLGEELPENGGEDSFSFKEVLDGNLDARVRTSMVQQSFHRVFGIRNKGWKFIDGLGSGGFTDPRKIEPQAQGPQGQLYNLREDPSESVNLYLEHPERVKDLQIKLEEIKAAGSEK